MKCETCSKCGQTIARPEIDWAEFSLNLRLALAHANMSLRQAEAATRVDQATIHRAAKHGKAISADAYVSLSAFIGEHKPKESSDAD